MNMWNQITARFGPKADMLGFAADATPSAHEWLVAFTTDFMGHADAAHSTQALMSGLRFYTPDFMAQIAALPPIETRPYEVAGNIPRAVYTLTGPAIVDVYQKVISRSVERGQVQAAFAQFAPVLVGRYNQKIH